MQSVAITRLYGGGEGGVPEGREDGNAVEYVVGWDQSTSAKETETTTSGEFEGCWRDSLLCARFRRVASGKSGRGPSVLDPGSPSSSLTLAPRFTITFLRASSSARSSQSVHVRWNEIGAAEDSW